MNSVNNKKSEKKIVPGIKKTPYLREILEARAIKFRPSFYIMLKDRSEKKKKK